MASTGSTIPATPPSVSPLFAAAASGTAAQVQALIANGADPNGFKMVSRWTPLCEAIAHGNLGAVDALLTAGARRHFYFHPSPDFKIEGRAINFMYPLHLATILGHAAIVSLLLSTEINSEHVDVNCRVFDIESRPVEYDPNRGMPAIHLAAAQGNTEIVALLLAAGASADAEAELVYNSNGRIIKELRPLHVAKSGEMASFLVNQGANVHARARIYAMGMDYVGMSALHIAAIRNAHEMIDWLLDRGFDIMENGSWGTPMDCALRYGSVDTVRHLAALMNQIGNGALSACLRTKIETLEKLELLIEAGADVHERDEYLCTLLHDAVSSHWSREIFPDIVDLLLANGVDARLRTNNGFTAVDYLVRSIRFATEAAARFPKTASPALAALLAAGGSFPEENAPVRGLEVALVPVWRKAPQHMPRLIELLEPAMQGQVRAALAVLHRWVPEQEMRMKILDMVLDE